MPVAHIVRSTPIVRSARVLQLEGFFDVPPAARSELTWDVSLPIEEKPWNIGLIVGPSGCLAGEVPIYDPLDGTSKTIKERWRAGMAFHVLAMDREGQLVPTLAMPPVRYGQTALYDLVTDRGRLRVTAEHRLLVSAPDGGVEPLYDRLANVQQRLLSGERVLLPTNSDNRQQVREQDAIHWMRIGQDFQADCRGDFYSRDGRLPLFLRIDRESVPLQADALGRNLPSLLEDASSLEQERSQSCRWIGPLAKKGCRLQTEIAISAVERHATRGWLASLDSDCCAIAMRSAPKLTQFGITRQHEQVFQESSVAPVSSEALGSPIEGDIIDAWTMIQSIVFAGQDEYFDFHVPGYENYWAVGLIHHNCGKSSIAREMFGAQLIGGYDWPADKSIVDAFPAEMPIKDITGLLSSVGFSSPPSWLRPFGVLSNGEQFRATVARALAESPEMAVIDEFTSVVDRTVAQIGSSAVAKTVRRRGQKLIAVSCHYDILEWLQPDWVYEPATASFQWRLLRRRPDIQLEIVRVHSSAWQLFKKHHYLDSSLAACAICFCALLGGHPVAFSSAIHRPTHGWGEHRTVCLPDYQGVGIGNAISEYVAGLMASLKGRYMSTTSSPSMIAHRNKSPLWKMHRKPSMVSGGMKMVNTLGTKGSPKVKTSFGRFTAGFIFRGAANPEDAAKFGLVPAHRKAKSVHGKRKA